MVPRGAAAGDRRWYALKEIPSRLGAACGEACARRALRHTAAGTLLVLALAAALAQPVAPGALSALSGAVLVMSA